MLEERSRIFFWVGFAGIAVFGIYIHKVFQTFQPVANDHRATFTTQQHFETSSLTASVGEGNIGFYQTGSDNVQDETHVAPSFTLSLNTQPQLTLPSLETTEQFIHVVIPKLEDPTDDVHQLHPSRTTHSETDKLEPKKISLSYAHEDLSLPTSDVVSKGRVTNPTMGTTATSAPSTSPLSSSDGECYRDVLRGMKRVCRPKCSPGSRTFSLPGMLQCRPWLSCSEINSDIEIGNVIGEGAVKQVHVGTWTNFSVAVNKLRDSKYLDDFTSGLGILMELSGHPSVVQLIGICLSANTFITELHPLGNVLTFASFLRNHPEHEALDSVANRLQFCASYAQIVMFVHSSPVGTRVMCDSNELGKVHHQLLVTNAWRLILNDMDAMPLVNNDDIYNNVVCGSRELVGDFVAPEQLWPYPNRPFSASEQPPYNEKVDIWKMPDVCEYFLGDDDNDAEIVKYNLFAIHKRCKSLNPFERPTAAEVFDAYNSVLEKFR